MLDAVELEDKNLLAECLLNPRMYTALGALCDTVGGRTSGAPSGRQAEEWVASKLREMGVDRVWTEPVELRVWERGTLCAVVDNTWPLDALAHGNSTASAKVAAKIADVGHGERDDYAAFDAPLLGRIAFCDELVREGNRTLHRSEKLLLAVEFGASALIIMSSDDGGPARTGVCHYGEAPIPSIGISNQDGRRLRRELQRGNAPTVAISIENRFYNSTANSVIAQQTGVTNPDEFVLACAHLDCWDTAQGATDNGLGTAIVLQMADALFTGAYRFGRSVRFAFWAAEEVGLLGSKAYVATHAAELTNHIAVMNFDMTGRPTGYWTPGHSDPATLLVRLATQLKPLGMHAEITHKAGLHSDHQPFMLAGVPIVGLQSELSVVGGRTYHSRHDTFEKVSLQDFAMASAVGSITMRNLADAHERPLPHLDSAGVRRMIDEAELMDALRAEQYDGPAMHVAPST